MVGKYNRISFEGDRPTRRSQEILPPNRPILSGEFTTRSLLMSGVLVSTKSYRN